MEIEISREQLEGKSLFVGMPCYGGQMCALTAKCLIDLRAICLQYGIDMRVSLLLNESLINRARNYITDEFKRSDFTHMIFIDADILFDPKDVIILLAYQDKERQIIGAPYPKKHVLWKRVNEAASVGVGNDDPNKLAAMGGDFVFNPADRSSDISVYKPTKVLELGTGFMLFDKEVLTEFDKNYPEYEYIPDHNHSEHFNGTKKIFSYFNIIFDDFALDPENNEKRMLSEDYAFCQMMRKVGVDIWLCPWMQLSHIGSYVYGGSIPAIAYLEQAKMEFNNQQNTNIVIKD